MKNIVLVAGARPNFMKIAPLAKALDQYKSTLRYHIVHTGQHYDQKMSDDFFIQLGIPEPAVNLGAGGGTQAEQTAAIMIGFEKYLQQNPTDLVIVVGDVTSTLACSIVAKKLQVKVAHVEGGIRSGDITMPEEINRMVTDSISDFFFTTSRTANENLLREGKTNDQIFFVGNTMIDTLYANLQRLKKPAVWDEYNLQPQKYFLMTLHRPSNVDDPANLKTLLSVIASSAEGMAVVFPVHPRTRKNLSAFKDEIQKIHLADPLSYLEFIYLIKNSKGVITDSGGITEETTVLGIPCVTLRNSTERPETCTVGTNELIGTNPENIRPAIKKMLSNQWKKGSIPELWDGKAAERTVEIILTRLGV